MNFDVSWGGYYATVSGEADGEYSIFRLLDFNDHAYHAAIFAEKFPSLPDFEEVAALSPFIGHAPIDSRALVREGELHLVGHTPLTEDDLQGYRFYLEAHEVSEAERDDLVKTLIAFSHEPPLRLRLELVDDELVVSERT